MDESVPDSSTSKLPVGDRAGSLSSLVFNKVYNRVIPPLQSSFSHMRSNEPLEEVPDGDIEATDSSSTSTDSANGVDEDDIDVADTGQRSQKNLLSYLSTSQLYSEVQKYVLSHRNRSDSSGIADSGLTADPTLVQNSKPSRYPTLGYGIMEDSSEEEEEDEDEEEEEDDDDTFGFDHQNVQSITTTSDSEEEFEDAQDVYEGSKINSSTKSEVFDDNESDSTLRILNAVPLSNDKSSQDTRNSVISSALNSIKNSNDDKIDLDLLTTLQRSIVDNFEAYPRDSVLMKFTDEDQDVKPAYEIPNKMKVSIADKLQRVFNLDDDDYFYANYNAWLVRDVFLQGHIYVTKNCLLFFAFLPDLNPKPVLSEDDDFKRVDDSSVYIQSGSLTMKTKKYGEILGNVLTDRFWAILRPETLSIYSSPTDLYFPSLIIDLRTCLKVEILEKYQPKTESQQQQTTPLHESPSFLHPEQRSPSQDDFNDEEELVKLLALEAEENKENISGGVWFKLTTDKKSYKFQTDNLYSARQWVNNIAKIIFQLHNTNSKNEVLIKIPFERFGQIKRGTLFNTDLGSELGEYAEIVKNQLPSAFAFLYSTGAEQDSNAKKFQRKLLERAKQNVVKEIDWLHFAFFANSSKFEQVISQIINSHNDTELASSIQDNILSRMTKKLKKPTDKNLPVTTLLPFGNHSAILEQVVNANKNFLIYSLKMKSLKDPVLIPKLRKSAKHYLPRF